MNIHTIIISIIVVSISINIIFLWIKVDEINKKIKRSVRDFSKEMGYYGNHEGPLMFIYPPKRGGIRGRIAEIEDYLKIEYCEPTTKEVAGKYKKITKTS